MVSTNGEIPRKKDWETTVLDNRHWTSRVVQQVKDLKQQEADQNTRKQDPLQSLFQGKAFGQIGSAEVESVPPPPPTQYVDCNCQCEKS